VAETEEWLTLGSKFMIFLRLPAMKNRNRQIISMLDDKTNRIWMIHAYFDLWREDIKRVKILLQSQEHYLEAILVLLCFIGALAAERFPGRGDRDAYIKIINRYSGLKSVYNKVDLLFFYQWPRSHYRRSKSKHSLPYRKIAGYSKIKKKIVRCFGDEQEISNDDKKRYIPISRLLKHLDPPPKGCNRKTILENLKLFTLSEILYRYFRCHAVHEKSFPLIRRISYGDGTTRYEDGHLITGPLIFETVRNIVNNLGDECLSKKKLPQKLINR